MNSLLKTVEFKNYKVEIYKHSLIYIFNSVPYGTQSYPIRSFENSIDKEENGGKIEIKYKDSWGSEMIFIHYKPSDLQYVFDFIGKGFGIKI